MELISRDEAIDALCKAVDNKGKYEGEWLYTDEFVKVVQSLPTIEERKEGRWIDKGRDDDVYDIKGVKTWATKGMCSECGFTTWFIESHMCYAYCPQCGSYNSTKMKGE